jgi:hypothetical protein
MAFMLVFYMNATCCLVNRFEQWTHYIHKLYVAATLAKMRPFDGIENLLLAC